MCGVRNLLEWCKCYWRCHLVQTSENLCSSLKGHHVCIFRFLSTVLIKTRDTVLIGMQVPTFTRSLLAPSSRQSKKSDYPGLPSRWRRQPAPKRFFLYTTLYSKIPKNSSVRHHSYWTKNYHYLITNDQVLHSYSRVLSVQTSDVSTSNSYYLLIDILTWPPEYNKIKRHKRYADVIC